MERIEAANIWLLIQKEIRDTGRSRWFIIFSLAFIVLALALAWLGLAGIGSLGIGGFSRTAASMVNLVLLMVPLMGLVMGAMNLSSERERGYLLYLLSQPISMTEAILGKYAGLSLSMLATLLLGFGASGLVMVLIGGTAEINSYISLVLFAFLLAMISLSVGTLIAVLARGSSAAIGLALFIWLGFVFLADLGIMGTAIVLKMDIGTLLTSAIMNPLQVFKIASVLQLQGNLEVLGPAGIYAFRTYGNALLPLLTLLLILWILIPLLISIGVSNRRGGV